MIYIIMTTTAVDFEFTQQMYSLYSNEFPFTIFILIYPSVLNLCYIYSTTLLFSSDLRIIALKQQTLKHSVFGVS